MKFFLDTEFIERGREHPMELISIGVVAEDGSEFYEVLCDWEPDHASEWVKENVLPHLGTRHRTSPATVAQELRLFCGDSPELWGYFCDYDWVVLCQLFGTMMDLPPTWPMFCLDVKQLAVSLGNPRLPKQESGAHNALADARHIKRMHEFLMGLKGEAS